MANGRVTKDGGCIYIVGVNPEDHESESVASSDVTNKCGGAFIKLRGVRIGPVANIGMLDADSVSIVTDDVKGHVGLADHLSDGAIAIDVIMSARGFQWVRGRVLDSRNYSSEGHRISAWIAGDRRRGRCRCVDHYTPNRTRRHQRCTSGAARLPRNTTARHVGSYKRVGDR
jgi:hypothetical protein